MLATQMTIFMSLNYNGIELVFHIEHMRYLNKSYFSVKKVETEGEKATNC